MTAPLVALKSIHKAFGGVHAVEYRAGDEVSDPEVVAAARRAGAVAEPETDETATAMANAAAASAASQHQADPAPRRKARAAPENK